MPDEPSLAAVRANLEGLVDNVERVIFGKRRQILLAVIGLLSEGHVLLEDVPGTGKTTLARALARSLDLEFRRIQFTSDLMPSDVVGVSVLDAASGEFAFKPGPVFAHVILADELNRTTPRTQSALLECMSDRRVSVDGTTHTLPRPFMVLATQNPLEFEGTYPLPESQLDRFLLRIAMGYPAREDERRVLRARSAGGDVEDLKRVLTREELLAAIAAVRTVRVDPAIEDYILSLLEGTRRGGRFALGPLDARGHRSRPRVAGARVPLGSRLLRPRRREEPRRARARAPRGAERRRRRGRSRRVPSRRGPPRRGASPMSTSTPQRARGGRAAGDRVRPRPGAVGDWRKAGLPPRTPLTTAQLARGRAAIEA